MSFTQDPRDHNNKGGTFPNGGDQNTVVGGSEIMNKTKVARKE